MLLRIAFAIFILIAMPIVDTMLLAVPIVGTITTVTSSPANADMTTR
jgi:hypothetical protein